MTHNPAEYYVIHDNHSWYLSVTEYLERIETNGMLTPYWGGVGQNKIRDRIVMLSDRVYAIEALTANLMIGSTKEATWFGIRANARAHT